MKWIEKYFKIKITFEWKLCFITSFIFNIYSKKFIEIQKLNFWITLVQFWFFWPRFSQNVLLFEKHFFISIKNYVLNNTKLTRKCYSKKWKNILGYFPEILGIFHIFFCWKFFDLKNTFFQKSFRFSLIFGNFYFLFLNKNILGKLYLNYRNILCKLFVFFDENENGFEEKRKIYLFLFLIFPDKLGKFESIIKRISLFGFLF